MKYYALDGSELVFEVLHVIEFTSTRKRMSVVVRTPENKIKLYSKVSLSLRIDI